MPALQMPIATTTPIQNRIAGGRPPSSTNAAMISSPQNAVWTKSEWVIGLSFQFARRTEPKNTTHSPATRFGPTPLG
ncbi:hypothetical protein EBU58_04605 [bacterium]|nr:hypothetical protein [bacterium]